MGRTRKVVLYEPSGRGGICHYTYELAQALAGRGADVTLLTTSTYELEHLPRGSEGVSCSSRAAQARALPIFWGLRCHRQGSLTAGKGRAGEGSASAGRWNSLRLCVWNG